MTTYDPAEHYRRSIRLKDYDYRNAGWYFVTICVHERESALGKIVNGVMQLSRYGKIVDTAWRDLPKHCSYVVLDEFCIMPNHAHCIIILIDDDRRDGSPQSGSETLPARKTHPSKPRHPLSEIIRAFKSFSSKRINALRKTTGNPFWQSNYYEHIIRNDREYKAIKQYRLRTKTTPIILTPSLRLKTLKIISKIYKYESLQEI
jgi:REP element-mobilizing transposase RayT